MKPSGGLAKNPSSLCYSKAVQSLQRGDHSIPLPEQLSMESINLKGALECNTMPPGELWYSFAVPGESGEGGG